MLHGDISSRISSSATLIDSWEDGDITEYSNDTGQFAVVDDSNLSTNRAVDGTKSLEAASGTGESIITSQSGDGLNAYYNQGDGTLVAYNETTGLSNTDYRLWFGVANNDTTTGYNVRLEYFNDQFTLMAQGGFSTSNAYTYSTGTTYRVEVDWQTDDTITATLYDDDAGTQESSITETDSTYAGNEGVGVSSYTGSNTYTDYYHKV